MAHGPSAHGSDVGSLRALGALGDFELHVLVLGQGLEAAALDFTEVGKEILAAVVGGDEAEALAFVEPFHDAGLCGHVDFLSRLPEAKNASGEETRRKSPREVRHSRRKDRGKRKKTDAMKALHISTSP